MDYTDFREYLLAMPIIKARETLEAFEVASYPHAKKENRERLFRQYHKQAYAQMWQEKKTVTLADVARILSRG